MFRILKVEISSSEELHSDSKNLKQMQTAVYKYIPGKKVSAQGPKTVVGFASFTVEFLDSVTQRPIDAVFNDHTIGGYQFVGTPMLCVCKVSPYQASRWLEGDVDNLNPMLIKLCISHIGTFLATSARESTLFMRMKPHLQRLFDQLAHKFSGPGEVPVIARVSFVDEVVTDTIVQVSDPDRIYFSCNSQATYGTGNFTPATIHMRSLHVIYDKSKSEGTWNSKDGIWIINDLDNIIVPEYLKNYAGLPVAFKELAKNMCEGSPLPEDAEVWKFHQVTKTITQIEEIVTN